MSIRRLYFFDEDVSHEMIIMYDLICEQYLTANNVVSSREPNKEGLEFLFSDLSMHEVPITQHNKLLMYIPTADIKRIGKKLTKSKHDRMILKKIIAKADQRRGFMLRKEEIEYNSTILLRMAKENLYHVEHLLQEITALDALLEIGTKEYMANVNPEEQSQE
jgi:hypothetical protein